MENDEKTQVNFNAEPVEPAQAIPAKKISQKIPMLIGIVAAVAVVVVLLFAFIGGGNSSSAEPRFVAARYAEDGTAYLLLEDGKCITINDEVFRTVITPDRKNVVVLLEDGTLYVTDKDQSKKTVVTDNGDRLIGLKDEGFLYEDSDNKAYRVSFSGGTTAELGETNKVFFAKDTMSVVFEDGQGGIYTLPYNSSERVRVGKNEDEVELNAVSNDGVLAVWTLIEGSNKTIVLCEGDEKETLGTVYSKYSSGTGVSFTKDQKLAVVTNYNGDRIYIKQPGKETVTVKFNDELSSNAVYTADGIITKQSASKVKGIYVLVDAENGSNLYYVTLNGEKERVLSKVSRVNFSNGNIVYLDTESNLYTAKVSGANISDEKKLSGDAWTMMRVTDNGSYLYYMKDCDDESGTLCCYKFGEKEAKRVASDVSLYDGWLDYIQIGSDGKTVYFLKDVERIKGTYTDCGDLYVWSYGKGESEKLASEVIENSLTSNLTTGEINKNGFVYFKFNSKTEDEILIDAFYYNGKESVKMASELTY